MELWELINFKAFFISALVFIPLERLTALYADQKIFRAHWKNDLVFIFVNSFAIKIPVIIIYAMFLGPLYRVVPPSIHHLILSQPIWVQAIEVIILADTSYYFAHRAFHAIPFLWRFHSIHHSIEEMDWLASFRVHPIDQIITQSVSLLPVYALGFSGHAIFIYAVIYQWVSLLIHSNTKIQFGPLKWVLASPQFHHWHHGNQPDAYNKNFAAQLPAIDMIFGTLHLPKAQMPTKYGVDDDIPKYYHQQFIYPFTKRNKRNEARTSIGRNTLDWNVNENQN